MKKSIINLIVCATITTMSSGVFAATDQMFNNTSSKEWGNTPQNVRNALKDIKVMSGSSSNDMMSKNWLNELKRSPSTYNLNQNDVAWVSGMLNQTNGKTWNPKTRVSVGNSVVASKNTETKNKDVPARKEVKEKNTPKVESVKSEQPVKSEPEKMLPTKKVQSNAEKNTKVKKEKSISEKELKLKNEKLKNEKERIEKEKNEKERLNNIAKINSDIDNLKNNEKVINEVQRVESENRGVYNEQISKLSNLNNLNLIIQNDKNYQDMKDGTDKLKDMIKETNKTLLEQQSIIKKDNSDISLSKSKKDEEVKVKTEVKTSPELKKEKNMEANATKVVNEVSNSMKKNEIATTLIKEDIKGNLKSQKMQYSWKSVSIYIIAGFSLITLLFMKFLGFNKREED